MQVKIEMGEWVNVYQHFVGWVYIPDGQEITPETIEESIDTRGIDYEMNDYDWTTEDHEKWDFDGLKVLDIQKQQTKGDKNED